MKRLRIQEPARREFAEATKWYLERDAEAAGRFAAAVRLVFDLISEFPQVGGAASGVGDRNVRSMPVHKFPYHVVFMRFPDYVEVIAIAHNRRRPGYFVRRIRRS